MKIVLRVAAALLLLAMIALLVPSSVPLVIAEEIEYPTYTPVTLETGFEPLPWDNDAHYAPDPKGYKNGNWDYDDPSIHVHTVSFRAYKSTVMVTYVQIADPTQLRTKIAGDKIQSKRTMHVSGKNGMGGLMKAVVSMSGDNCKDDANAGSLKGGYIVRNGAVLRSAASERDRLVIDDEGNLTIVDGDGTGESGRLIQKDALNRIQETFGSHVIHCFNFGPGLVRDGVRAENEYMYRFGHSAPKKRAQRIALCQLNPEEYPLTYMIVCTSGPQNPNSEGLTMPEFANVVMGLGAWQAYNLDGGSSSSVVLNCEKINKMRLNNDREISDAICFVTAVPGKKK